MHRRIDEIESDVVNIVMTTNEAEFAVSVVGSLLTIPDLTEREIRVLNDLLAVLESD